MKPSRRRKRAITIGVAALLAVPGVFAQPRTHVVVVNADGSFTPRVLYVKSGDTVRWEQLTRTDSIIPASGSEYPAVCDARAAYSASDPNQLAGPMPFAPSGVFVLSPLDRGFVEASGRCPANLQPVSTANNGKLLCAGGEYQATMNETWRSLDATGVFIRLLWSDVNPSPGVYDFTALRRELEQSVKNGKLYSLGIKAGDDGTPDWIFSTNSNDTPRAGGGGGVPRLHFQDVGDAGATGCGARMDLGNPTRATYKQLYFAMLTEVAKFIKSRADWYRALAYVKISGANLISHENRLPDGCETSGQTRCICNPAVFAGDGYRPSGLYGFYDEQNQLLRNLFPDKPLSYALIQAGFPRVNESGGYLNYDGNSSNASPLPGGTEQTETNLDRGQQALGRYFVVQHNGVGQKRGACNFEGVHPKPVRALGGYSDAPCPNKWAVREGAEGQITGFQTRNRSDVLTTADLDSTFQNTWDNSDGVFLEIYEQSFWEAVNNNKGVLPTSGKTLGGWAEDLHRRRVDPVFPNFTAAGNPFPTTFSRTLRNANADGAPQTLTYIHGSKCGLGRQEWGQIVIDAQPPAISAGGVVTALAFGGFTSVAPGSWVEIYGSNLASGSRSWTGADFNGATAPVSLDGTSVRIGGQAAFVDYISPGQVNAQIPSGVAAGPQPITVMTAVGTSAAYTVTVNPAQPGLLAPPSFKLGGTQYVTAMFPDGVTYMLPPGAIAGVPSRRARPGDTIVLYGVGFGPVTPNIPAGQTVQQSNTLATPIQIFFGQARATLSYSGLAPNAVGLYQFNVVVPNVPAGDNVPLTFTLGGAAGTQSLAIAISN